MAKRELAKKGMGGTMWEKALQEDLKFTGPGFIEVVEGIYFHYDKGKVYCVQIDHPLDMNNTLVGELGGNVYLAEGE